MELNIVGPTHRKTVLVSWVELETNVGNIVIQPGHAPMILVLARKKPVTFSLQQGTQETLDVSGGIAQVTREAINLMLND